MALLCNLSKSHFAGFYTDKVMTGAPDAEIYFITIKKEVMVLLGGIFNKSKVVEKSLDAAWLRNEAISQNIANVDTPGYKRKTVAFEEYLAQALDEPTKVNNANKPGQFPIGKQSIDDLDIKITEDNKSLSTRLDGNNIDIDNEAAELAKNSIKYNVLVQSLNAGYKRLKSVISEGRR